MTRHFHARDPLLDAAASAADGKGTTARPDTDRDSERILRNLSRLASLKLAFARLDGDPHGATMDAAEGPSHWGHLSLLGEIGAGGFGVVYRAFDPVLEREVALKLQRSGMAQARAAGWIEEARRLARVRHPNVLAVHGAGVNEGRVGLWADLIDGATLQQVLERDGALPRMRLAALARDAGSALAAIHAAGLTHGDIKSANVMIEGDRAILMDFGAAARLGDMPRFGTPGAMAPEIVEGAAASATSDIYSLGLMLCCAALGREASAVHVHEGLHSDLRRRLGRPLQRLLLWMLEAQPGQRPTAGEVLAELDRIESLPRRRARRLALAAVILSLATGLALAVSGMQRARLAQADAESERQRAESVNVFLVDLLAAPQPTREGERVRVVEMLDQAQARLQGAGRGLPANVRADLSQVLGRSFGALGRNDEALSMLDEALQIRTTLHGPDHPRSLEVEWYRLETLAHAGMFAAHLEEAKHLYERTVRHTGGDSPLPALIASRIGREYLDQGELAAARRWLEPQYQRRDELAWRVPHDRAIIDLHWLSLLQRLGEVDAMLEGARQTRSVVEAHAGPRHTNALIARNFEIGALLQRGRHAEAEQAASEQFEIVRDWLGEDHPYALSALASMASAVSDQGRSAEAAALHARVHEAKARVQGADHPNTLVSALNLANALRAQAETERAEALYQEVIAKLPEKNDVALLARGNLAELYVESGDFHRAEATASAALDLMQTALGVDHLFTQHARGQLGAAELGLGRLDRALPLLEQAAAGIERYLGAGHLVTLNAKYRLGLALIESGERARARVLLEEVLESRTVRLGDAHPKTLEAKKALEDAALQ